MIQELNFKRFFASLMLLAVSTLSWAYDFVVGGIYYNITDGNNVEVTYRGLDHNSYSGTVVIPSSVWYDSHNYTVTSIGMYAFDKCSGLTSVTIPNSVTNIGANAFNGCSSLTSITIPNSVTSIGFSAFYNCSGLTSVTIPNSVTSIGSCAFRNCSGITSVTISNSVTEILRETFYNCSSLTSINIPNSVTSIDEYAFTNCSGLTSVTMPNSVTRIDGRIFDGCTSLPVINNVRYADTYLVEAVDRTQSTYSIRSGTRFIGDYAFYNCSDLTSITIRSSVTSIGNSAFSGCSGLTSVTIGNSVTSIGNYAFYYCSGLTSVTCLAEEVPGMGSQMFTGVPQSTATLYVPAGSVDAYKAASQWNAFGRIRGIILSGGCGWSAEFVLTNDYKLTISGNGYMYDYDDYWDYDESTRPWKDYSDQIRKVVVKDGVKGIGESAFYGCSGLTSITIPESVTSIGSYAFYRCQSLKSITCLAENVPTTGSDVFDNVPRSTATLYVPAGSVDAYKEADEWKEFGTIAAYIPPAVIDFADANVKAICVANWDTNDDWEFDEDEAAAVTSLGVVFKNNTTITSFDELQYFTGLTTIGYQAFMSCSGLTSVTIPNSVTSIGDRAFSSCSGLTSVTIPNSVTSIGNYAFQNCSSLSSVNALAETPSSIQSTTIPSTIAKIRVPETAVSAYKAATNWSAFSAKIIALGGEDNSITIEEIEENKAAGGSANQTYIVTDAAADDVKAADNVIVHSGDNYTCANLVLSDGEPFETMAEEFTATAATYTRNVSVSNTSGTICVPYAFAKEDGVKYYTVDNTRSDAETIYLSEISGDIVPAATPVIYIKDGGKTTMTFSGSNAVAKKAAGTGSGTFELRGTFEKTTITESDELAKSYALSGGKFLCSTTKLTINPFRAYLYNTGAVAEARLNLSVEDDDEPTGITSENVALMSGDAEIEGYYTLDGKRVGSLQKGVVTVIRYANGKSVKVFAQ